MRFRATLILAIELIAVLVGIAGCTDNLREGAENRRLNDYYSRRDCC